MKRKNPAAVALGRKGGKAGRGKCKARSSEAMRAAANVRWQAAAALHVLAMERDESLPKHLRLTAREVRQAANRGRSLDESSCPR